MPDPRIPEVTQADYQAQFAMAVQVRDSLDAVQTALRRVDEVREQVAWITERVKDLDQDSPIIALSEQLVGKLDGIEAGATADQTGADGIQG